MPQQKNSFLESLPAHLNLNPYTYIHMEKMGFEKDKTEKHTFYNHTIQMIIFIFLANQTIIYVFL